MISLVLLPPNVQQQLKRLWLAPLLIQLLQKPLKSPLLQQSSPPLPDLRLPLSPQVL